MKEPRVRSKKGRGFRPLAVLIGMVGIVGSGFLAAVGELGLTRLVDEPVSAVEPVEDPAVERPEPEVPDPPVKDAGLVGDRPRKVPVVARPGKVPRLVTVRLVTGSPLAAGEFWLEGSLTPVARVLSGMELSVPPGSYRAEIRESGRSCQFDLVVPESGLPVNMVPVCNWK